MEGSLCVNKLLNIGWIEFNKHASVKVWRSCSLDQRLSTQYGMLSVLETPVAYDVQLKPLKWAVLHSLLELAVGCNFNPGLYEDQSNYSFGLKITALHCTFSTCCFFSWQGWPMYAQLLIDLFKYLAPFLRNVELTKPMQILYKVKKKMSANRCSFQPTLSESRGVAVAR